MITFSNILPAKYPTPVLLTNPFHSPVLNLEIHTVATFRDSAETSVGILTSIPEFTPNCPLPFLPHTKQSPSLYTIPVASVPHDI